MSVCKLRERNGEKRNDREINRLQGKEGRKKRQIASFCLHELRVSGSCQHSSQKVI